MMEERWRPAEMFDGTFFAEPRDCNITKDQVEPPKMVELAVRI